MALSLKTSRCYPADVSAKHWRGTQFDDSSELQEYLGGPVRARVTDADFEKKLASDLQALATTP